MNSIIYDQIPQSMRKVIYKLSAFRKNQYRFNCNGKTTDYRAGESITFNLPTNSICDFDSFTVQALATFSGGASMFVDQPESLIQQLTLRAGGDIICQIQNYNDNFALISNYTGSTDHQRTKYSMSVVGSKSTFGIVAQNVVDSLIDDTGDELGVEINVGDAGAGTGTIAQKYRYQNLANRTEPIIFSTWLGLMSYLHIQDLSFYPQIEVEMVLASINATNGDSIYQLDNLAGVIDTLQFPLLSESLLSVLQEGMEIIIPFKNYVNYTFSQQATQTHELSFGIASSNLSRIWLTRKAHNYNTRSAGHPASGRVRYFRFCAQDTPGDDASPMVSSAQLSLDSQLYPLYKLDVKNFGLMFNSTQLKHIHNDTQYDWLIENPLAYRSSRWALIWSFDESSSEDLVLGGYDTSGMSSQVRINLETGVYGANQKPTPAPFTNISNFIVVCETIALLKVSAGRILTIQN